MYELEFAFNLFVYLNLLAHLTFPSPQINNVVVQMILSCSSVQNVGTLIEVGWNMKSSYSSRVMLEWVIAKEIACFNAWRHLSCIHRNCLKVVGGRGDPRTAAKLSVVMGMWWA